MSTEPVPFPVPRESLPPPAPRLAGIDAFRYFSFVAVVVLHCNLVTMAPLAPDVIDHLTRFAVPFFFIAGGFFIGRRDDTPRRLLGRLAARLMPVFLVWALVYILVAGQAASLKDPRFLAMVLLTGGPGFHLWFLPALMAGAAGLILCRRFGWTVLFALAGGLYLAGLIFEPYRVLAGLPPPAVPIHDGPFGGFPFVLLGYWFARRDVGVPWKTALAIAGAGLGLQLAEGAALYLTGTGYFAPHDYLAGTGLYGAGMFLLARGLPETPFIRKIAPLGRFALGMYCIHMIFLWALTPYLDRHVLWQSMAMAAIVVPCATCAARMLADIPGLRRLVS